MQSAVRLKCSSVAAFFIILAAGLTTGSNDARAAASPVAAIQGKLHDPNGGVFVVAHRGCHSPYPPLNMPSAPENSLAALEQCVRLGVDMMETDIRRAGDGSLIVMHDATVDRTTDGVGRLVDMTLPQIRGLRLRDNFGGAMSPVLTAQRVLTLDEMLAAAKGRIMLNLDIKEAIYPEVIAAVVRAGSSDEVLVKIVADSETTPLADQKPYSLVPFMPIVWQRKSPRLDRLGEVVALQASASHRIAGIEMVYLDQVQFDAVRAAAQKANVRLWANTLTSVGVLSIIGMGGDIDALRDHGRTWGRLIDSGITMFQTDEPGFLLDYLKHVKADRR